MNIFKNDLNEIDPFVIKIYDAEVFSPTSRKIYFLSKFHDIITRYRTARRYLDKTLNSDWSYLLKNVDDDVRDLAKLNYRAEFYEIALINYNIAFDLSWVLCYVSLEYELWRNGKCKVVGELEAINQAEKFLRQLEQYTSTPGAVDNPLAYLKTKNIKYENIIDEMEAFWKKFSNHSVRNKYNFNKHRGKFAYTEMLALDDNPKSTITFIHLDGKEEKLPSHISDVQNKCSLEDSINELIEFDNEELFPYTKNLVEKLSYIIKPSPIMDF